MPMDPEPKWKEALGSIPPSSGIQWAMKMADAVDGLCTGKAQLSGITGSVSFTFNKAIFAAQLLSVAPSPTTAIAAQVMANCWSTAMMASMIVVAPGSSFGSPALPTLWSVVILSMLDIPSIMLAKVALGVELTVLQVVQKEKESPLGPAFRNAFLKCTATVSGLNSLLPPPAGPGPLPLIVPMVPLM